MEAMLVERDTGEEIRIVVERFGLGEGGMDESVGVQFQPLSFGTAHNGSACALAGREGEEVVFQGVDALEPPVGVGDGLDAFGFEQTLRLQLGVELGAVLLIGVEIIRGEHDGLAGKAVTKGVEGYPAPAFCSYGAG